MLLPVFVLALLILIIFIPILTEEYKKNSQNLLYQYRIKLENLFNEVNYMNIELSMNTELFSLLKQASENKDSNYSVDRAKTQANRYLIPLIASRSYIDSMYIYIDNENGRFFSIPQGLVNLNSYPDYSWYHSYDSKKELPVSLWSDTRSYKRYSFEERTDVMTIYQKLYYQNGVSVINIDLNHLQRELDALLLPEHQDILIFNQDGELLLKTSSSGPPSPEFLKALLSLEPDEASFLYNRRHYQITREYSALGDLQCISVIPVRTIYSSIYKVLLNVLLIVLVISMLSILLALHVSRRFYRNIMQIVDILTSEDPVSASGAYGRFPSKGSDLYYMITQNILHLHLQQNQLKMQIMENHYTQKNLELKALQAQMSPHFLINTLKSIFWMSYKMTASKNTVCEMVENMTDILSYSLTSKDALVPLSEEIRHTKSYIEIQRVRYQYRFDVSWDFSQEVLSLPSIKFLLQPIVENAILHGFHGNSSGNRIRIRIRKDGNRITIRVIDNGTGIPDEKLAKIQEALEKLEGNDQHIGIYNCNRRLHLIFGQSAGITVHSRKGLGTVVKICFPPVFPKPLYPTDQIHPES